MQSRNAALCRIPDAPGGKDSPRSFPLAFPYHASIGLYLICSPLQGKRVPSPGPICAEASQTAQKSKTPFSFFPLQQFMLILEPTCRTGAFLTERHFILLPGRADPGAELLKCAAGDSDKASGFGRRVDSITPNPITGKSLRLRLASLTEMDLSHE